MKTARQRLEFLARECSLGEWRVLGALSLERRLPLGALTGLASRWALPLPLSVPANPGRPNGQREPDWLDRWLKVGLVVRLPKSEQPTSALGGPLQPWFSVAEEYRQLVSRRMAVAGELSRIAEAAHKLLGSRSLSPFVLLLQSGRLADYVRYSHALPSAGRVEGEKPPGSELLRETVDQPFEQPWFEGTYGEAALPAAALVLRHALGRLAPCDDVLAWANARVAPSPTTDPLAGSSEVWVATGCSEASLQCLLCEHALLRGVPEGAEQRITGDNALSTGQRLGYSIALDFLHGDLPAATRKLEQAFGFAEGKARPLAASALTLPEAGALSPLLALMLVAHGSPAAEALARRLLSGRSAGAESGAARALKTLLHYGSSPLGARVRLDVHQLARGASAWELLILGITVHLYLDQDVVRASWSRQLVRSGADWFAAGYGWAGRQALFLARALDAVQFEQELELVRDRVFSDRLQPSPGELSLAELVRVRPEWELTLSALSQLADDTAAFAEEGRRVVFRVNLADGSLDRPSLSELGRGGWTRGKRMSPSKLWELLDELPPEDVAVLRCTQSIGGDRRQFTPEAYEALIAHPRVVHGARGDARVEVARGNCRVEVQPEGDDLLISVEPPGLSLGVNVRVEGDSRLVVYRVTPALQKVIDLLPSGLRVPKGGEHEAFSVLGKLAHGVDVTGPHLGAERQIDADATPCLRISPVAGSWTVQAGVRPFGPRGRFCLPGAGEASLMRYADGQHQRCQRHFERELAAVSGVLLTCPSLLEQVIRGAEETAEPGPVAPSVQNFDFNEEGLLGLLSELRECGVACELEWPESEALRVRGQVHRGSLSANLRRRKGWYLMTGGVQIDGGVEIDLGDLAAGDLVAGGRFVRLPNGDFLEVERRVRRVMAALAGTQAVAGRSRQLRIHEAALGLIDELSELGPSLEVDPEVRANLDRAKEVGHQVFELPPGLNAELRPYQLDGYRWLRRLASLGFGACLADDMGLGKTVQVLALLMARAEHGPALVVAPTSVCENWAREAARFAPTLCVLQYAGGDRDRKPLPGESGHSEAEPAVESLDSPRARSAPADLVICSYGILQGDVERLSQISWGTVVLDEAQFIKNSRSLRARAACRLQALQRVAMTGTPVENHLGDLWSIFHFLQPGLLGSARSFNSRYVKAVDKERNVSLQATLRAQVQPFILRRTKSEVLGDLPPLTVLRHDVELSESETSRYALLRRQIHDKLYTAAGRRDNKLEILAEITRLRRFCCHPRLVFPDARAEGSKVRVFLDLVEELRESEHRALVFSQYVDFLGIVREHLDEVGISYQYLDGSTPQSKRQASVDAFQAGEGTLFLISLKAGGFGLNLTAADYVIHLDPWWNPAVEAQATDRAHRIGQSRPVTVCRLVTRDTIEESIVRLHERKRAVAESLLAGGGQAAQLETSELLDLIEGAVTVTASEPRVALP